MTRRVIEMVGKTFGQLTVVCRAGSGSKKDARWLCKCSCGKECTAIGANLRKGYTKSCGCLRQRTFVSNLRQGRDRANARKRQPAPIVIDTAPDLAPLLDAAREWWARRGEV